MNLAKEIQNVNFYFKSIYTIHKLTVFGLNDIDKYYIWYNNNKPTGSKYQVSGNADSNTIRNVIWNYLSVTNITVVR